MKVSISSLFTITVATSTDSDRLILSYTNNWVRIISVRAKKRDELDETYDAREIWSPKPNSREKTMPTCPMRNKEAMMQWLPLPHPRFVNRLTNLL